MNTGDTIKIRFLADQLTAKVLEAEKYRDAWILHYQFADGRKAYCTVFPEIATLPPATIFSQELYDAQGWLEWEDHIWPIPMKRRSGVPPGADHRAIARKRIDLVLQLQQWTTQGVDRVIEIVPNTEWEHAQWKKLEQNRNGT